MLFPCFPERIKRLFRFGYKYSDPINVVENVNNLIFVFFNLNETTIILNFCTKKDFEANSVEELSVKNLDPKIV